MMRAMTFRPFGTLKWRSTLPAASCIVAASVARAQTSPSPSDTLPLPPVPASISWLTVVLFGLLWLLISAAILGPLVRFFAAKPPAEPRNLPVSY